MGCPAWTSRVHGCPSKALKCVSQMADLCRACSAAPRRSRGLTIDRRRVSHAPRSSRIHARRGAGAKELWIETGDALVMRHAQGRVGIDGLFWTGSSTDVSAQKMPVLHFLTTTHPTMREIGAQAMDTEWRVGHRVRIESAADLLEAVSMVSPAAASLKDNEQPDDEVPPELQHLLAQPILLVECSDWSIIPAENLVAALQTNPVKLLMYVKSRQHVAALLGALEAGIDGVALQSDDISEIDSVVEELHEINKAAEPVDLEVATVTEVQQLANGDRVCVDLCEMCAPGEGMLIGNFCRALFLVHSECEESEYINSRPFRVNAGAVHAYVQAPEGKTAYLSELKAGSTIEVVNSAGVTRTATVGRCKVERRPLTLVKACTANGREHSVILQTAETVKLVGPSEQHQPGDENSWNVQPVTDIQPGAKVYVSVSEEIGRHAGMAVEEALVER